MVRLPPPIHYCVAAQLGEKSREFEEQNTTDVLSDYTGDPHGLRPLRCKNKSNQINRPIQETRIDSAITCNLQLKTWILTID
jgi:hypothetical protein